MIDSIILVSQAVVWLIISFWAVVVTLALFQAANREAESQKAIQERKERIDRDLEREHLEYYRKMVDEAVKKYHESKDRNS